MKILSGIFGVIFIVFMGFIAFAKIAYSDKDFNIQTNVSEKVEIQKVAKEKTDESTPLKIESDVNEKTDADLESENIENELNNIKATDIVPNTTTESLNENEATIQKNIDNNVELIEDEEEVEYEIIEEEENVEDETEEVEIEITG